MSSDCMIIINPDVSGAGVRAAIYTQNILCFIPAIWAIGDGTVSHYELESAETHSTTNLVLAFAILICSLFQGASRELTNYHASIVLSLSWMNNTNAFVYFLLYVQYKSQGTGEDRIEPRLSAWGTYIRNRAKTIFCLPHARERSLRTENRERDAASKAKEASTVLFKRITILLGSLHLTLMAMVGLWLWSNPPSFGTVDSADCATKVVDLAIVGGHVRFGSPILRGVSLALYSIFLLPGLNLLLPILPFLAFHCWYHGRSQLPLPATTPESPRFRTAWSPRATRTALGPQMFEDLVPRLRRVLPVILGLAFLLIVNVVFIVDVELTLRRNAHLQNENESKWGFGQILAMLLVFMPLRDLIEAIIRRRQELQTKLNVALAGAIDKRDLKEIAQWVSAGASVCTQGDKGATALHVACSDLEHCDLVIELMRRGADPLRTSGQDGHTAYEIALSAGNLEGIATMIRASTPDFGRTVFRDATSKGKSGIVQAIASAGFGVDAAFPGGTTALEIVCKNNNWASVHFLAKLGEDVVGTKFKDGMNAWQVALLNNNWNGVYALAALDGGAKLDESATLLRLAIMNNDWVLVDNLAQMNMVDLDVAIFNNGMTPLQVAVTSKNWDAVQRLAKMGVDVATARFHDGTTALQVALLNRDWGGVSVLANLGVDVGAAVFPDGTTAWQVALSNEGGDLVHAIAELDGDTVLDGSMRDLREAVLKRDWDIVHNFEGDVNVAIFNNGMTPLQVALLNKDWHGLRILSKAGADVTGAILHDCAAALRVAVLSGDWEVVSALAEWNVDVGATAFEDGTTPLQVAVSNKDWAGVLVLAELNRGCIDSTRPDEGYVTAFRVAVINRDWDAVHALAKLEVDIDAPMFEGGQTALHVALLAKDWRGVRALALSSANVDDPLLDGRTALQMAYAEEHWLLVEVLLNAGARADSILTDLDDDCRTEVLSKDPSSIIQLLRQKCIMPVLHFSSNLLSELKQEGPIEVALRAAIVDMQLQIDQETGIPDSPSWSHVKSILSRNISLSSIAPPEAERAELRTQQITVEEVSTWLSTKLVMDVDVFNTVRDEVVQRIEHEGGQLSERPPSLGAPNARFQRHLTFVGAIRLPDGNPKYIKLYHIQIAIWRFYSDSTESWGFDGEFNHEDFTFCPELTAIGANSIRG